MPKLKQGKGQINVSKDSLHFNNLDRQTISGSNTSLQSKESLLTLKSSISAPSPEEFFRKKGFEICDEIGCGGFSKVFKVQNIKNGTIMAAKMMFLKSNEISKLWVDRCLKNEMLISKQLQHPNIVLTYEFFKTQSYGVIIMQYAPNGSIQTDLYKRKEPYDENEARLLFGGMINALQFMHQSNIAHRDIKLENFLLDTKRRPLLSDFGFSTVASKQRKLELETVMRKTRCGTPGYMAPEVVRLPSQAQYNAKAIDVWAIGVCLYEMLHGRMPYESDYKVESTYCLITKQSMPFATNIEQPCRDLIKSMLRLDPTSRPKASEVMTNRWLNPTLLDKLIDKFF